MYLHDFRLDVDDKELNEKLFSSAKSFLEEETEKLQKSVFDKVSEDMESFMYEKFENVQERYFREVKSFLLGEDVFIKQGVKERLTKWLSDLGYSSESFRLKVYEENKEDIVKQINYDALYDSVKNMFNDSYYKHWNFSDIQTNYPQSRIINGFMDALIEQNGFSEALSEKIDKKNKEKMSYLKYLQDEIDALGAEIDDIRE